MIRKRIVLHLIPLIIMVLASCGSPVLYEKTEQMPNNRWQRFNKLSYEFEVAGSSRPYDIDIELELTNNFELQELPLHITMKTPSGEIRMLAHTVEVKTGNNQMKAKKQGDLWELTSRVYSGFTYTQAGKVEISIENLHYKYHTNGVHSVTVVVEKSGGMAG